MYHIRDRPTGPCMGWGWDLRSRSRTFFFIPPAFMPTGIYFCFSVRPFVCSFVRSFVRSFVSSFVIPERSWNLCQRFC